MTQSLTSLAAYVEQLRKEMRLSQVDVSGMVGVTLRAYVAWTQGAKPQERRRKGLKYAQFLMEQGKQSGLLPIHGPDRQPQTAELRYHVVNTLLERYPQHD